MMADVKKIRHRISKRLAEAHKKGRLYQELRAIDREVDRDTAQDRRSVPKRKSV